MIEIVNDKERNLKNLKQIGTPREENKIYVENLAYIKMKEESYKEKRVFVLLGHTERMDGRYATFVEAAVPVREIDFVGTTPRWNNAIWNEVFREIKRLYEDMIIVGWAIDIRGMSPKITPELERVHREHFGGAHQLLFLLDTLEQEETFYMYKENKLIAKDGFYIYHRAYRRERVVTREQERYQEHVKPESGVIRRREREVGVEVELPETETRKGGRYRQLMQEEKKEVSKGGGNLGIVVAAAALVLVIGVGVYQNSGSNIMGNPDSVETNLLQEENSETEEENTQEEKDVISVEVVPGIE